MEVKVDPAVLDGPVLLDMTGTAPFMYSAEIQTCHLIGDEIGKLGDNLTDL